MALKTTPFDASEYIEDDEAALMFLEDAMETGDARHIASAIGDVARAKGMSAIAKETGMSRESLYRALSGDGNTQLSTVLKVLEAMGLKLTVHPKASDAA